MSECIKFNKVVALKKELAELKGARSKDARAQGAQPNMALLPTRAAFESLEAMLTPDAMELQLEKQAHQETFAALDAAEQCVLSPSRFTSALLYFSSSLFAILFLSIPTCH